MARTRKSAAPYSAQLKRLLSASDGKPAVFSATTLEGEFEIKPHQNRRTTINQIHQALRQAWEGGDIVAFIAPDGTELCEREFCVNGSAAVEHPQVFGLQGAPSPEDGYAPTTYAKFLQLNAEGDGHGEVEPGGELSSVANAEEPSDDGDDKPLIREDEVELADEQTVEEAMAASGSFKVFGPAPAWIPDRLLEHIVSLPNAVKSWRAGLDRARGAQKLQLIRAGVRRKGEIDSLTARKLAALCRGEPDWWGRAFWSAVRQYKEWGEWIADEDLPALRLAPDEFLLEHENRYHPEAIVLCGITLDADVDTLASVAAEAETVLEEEGDRQTVSVQEELRRRASTLEAETAELRRQLEDQEDEAKSQGQRAENLAAELERLREAQGTASSTDQQLADAERRNNELAVENASLRTRFERADQRASSSGELRQHITELERGHDELAVRAAAAENERKLREGAEARLQEQIAETRRLERELKEAGGVHVPVDDGGALMRALAKPIGEATEHAARRLAAGQPLPDDACLLQFAGAFGELAASVTPAEPTQPVPTIAAPPKQPSAQGARETDVVGAEPSSSRAAAPVDRGESDAVERAEDEQRLGEKPIQAPTSTRRRSRRTAPFTVHPFGGAGEVGGSAIVVQTRSGDTVLLDAGQRVKGEYGLDTQTPFHYSLPPFDHLDAIIVSHAHIDHIGSLPVLFREYQRDREDKLPILMSEPTQRVGEIMMRDSAKIQHKRQYQSFADLAQSDFAPELDLKPAYVDADISDALEAVEVLDPRQPRVISGTRLTVKLLPVAHVLGSCAVHLTDNDTGATLLYTGDLGPLTETQRTLPDFDGVNGFDPADVVIMESTYALPSENELAGKRNLTRDDALKTLYRAATKAADAGGHVLLPAFSLGRTQELLRVIEDATATGELPAGDVYIGGMGERISEIYSDYKGSPWVAPGEMRRATEMNRWLRDSVSFDEVVDEAVSRKSFSYIICSPAMLSGGWSRAFLQRMVHEERHAVVFTGYLPLHGGGIRNLAKLHTGGLITLDDATIKIECDWRKATLSAHAPLGDLRAFAQRMLLGGKQVTFGMVHGSNGAPESLAGDVNDFEGANATALSNGVPWKPQIG